MSVDDHIGLVLGGKSFRRWRTDLVSMADVNPNAFQFHVQGFWQLERGPIGVAEHGVDGSDVLECGKDLRSSDVTGVQDEINASQGPEGFGPNEAVSVRDEAYHHDFNIVS